MPQLTGQLVQPHACELRQRMRWLRSVILGVGRRPRYRPDQSVSRLAKRFRPGLVIHLLNSVLLRLP